MSAQLRLVQDETRFCPRCDEMRPIGEFGVSRNRRDGLNRYCRTCACAKVHEYRRRNKEWKQNKRRREPQPIAIEQQPASAVPQQRSSMDLVLEAVRQGAHTQKEIQVRTQLTIAKVDLALTMLLLQRPRPIGTRALTGQTRIYFCL